MCGCGRQLKLDIFFPGNMLNPDQVEYKITRLQDVTYSVNGPWTKVAQATPECANDFACKSGP